MFDLDHPEGNRWAACWVVSVASDPPMARPQPEPRSGTRPGRFLGGREVAKKKVAKKKAAKKAAKKKTKK